MAAPSYVAQGGAVAVVTSTAAPTYPAGIAAGDLLILFVCTEVAIQGTPPAGWTVLGSGIQTGGGLSVTTWTRISDGTETGTQNVTGITGNTRGVAWISAYHPAAAGVLNAEYRTGADTDSSSTAISASGSSWTTAVDNRFVSLTGMITSTGSYSASATGLSLTSAGSTVTQTARFAGRTASNVIYYGQSDAAVTAGGTGAPSFTATAATATGATAAGMVAFVRISESGDAGSAPAALGLSATLPAAAATGTSNNATPAVLAVPATAQAVITTGGDRPVIMGTPSVMPGTNTSGTVTPLVITTPVGAVTGETLIAVITSQGQTANDVGLPTGWNRIGLVTVNDINVRVLGFFAHYLQADPNASYSFTVPSASSRFGGIMFRVRNAYTVQPHGASISYGTLAASTVTMPTVSVSQPNTLHLLAGSGQVVAGVASTIATPPSGMTLVATMVAGLTAGSRTPLHVWSEDVGVGTIAAKTFTWTGAPAQATGTAVVLLSSAPVPSVVSPAVIAAPVNVPAPVTGDIDGFGISFGVSGFGDGTGVGDDAQPELLGLTAVANDPSTPAAGSTIPATLTRTVTVPAVTSGGAAIVAPATLAVPLTVQPVASIAGNVATPDTIPLLFVFHAPFTPETALPPSVVRRPTPLAIVELYDITFTTKLHELQTGQFSGTLRRNEPGQWQVETHLDEIPEQILHDVGAVVVRDERRVLFAGYRIALGDGGGGTVRAINEAGRRVTLEGVDCWHWLNSRVVFPDPGSFEPWAAAAADIRTGYGGAVIAQYIAANAGPTSLPGRAIDGLTTPTEEQVGAIGEWSGRLQPLSSLIRRIALESGLVVDPLMSPTLVPTIDVREAADRTLTLVVSDLGDLADIEQRDVPPASTWVLGAGSGEGVDRMFRSAGGGSGVTRIEKVVEQTNAATDTELFQFAESRRNEDELAFFMAGTLNRNAAESYRYLDDYRLGDLISVQIQGVRFPVPITGVQITVNPEQGLTELPVLGTFTPNRLVKMRQDIDDLAQRFDENLA